MLQSLNLQLTTNIDTESRPDPGSTGLQAAPGAGTDQQPDFASLLELDTPLLPGPSVTIKPGEDLPPPGKPLPPGPFIADVQPETVLTADNGEALTDTPLPVAVAETTILAQQPTPPPDSLAPPAITGLLPLTQRPGGGGRSAEISQAGSQPLMTPQPGETRPPLSPPALMETSAANASQMNIAESSEALPDLPQRVTAAAMRRDDAEPLPRAAIAEKAEIASDRDARSSLATELGPGREKLAQLLTSSPDKQPLAGNWRQDIVEATSASRTQSESVIMVAARHTAASHGGVAGPASTPTLAIDVPLDSPEWGQQLGERVLLMAGNRLQSAEIRLSPAEMGPVRVHVSIDDGNTTVTFHAQHALTRDVLEQSLPRLRELFADTGLSLGEASVNEEGVNRERSEGGFADESFDAEQADAEDLASVSQQPATVDRRAAGLSTSLVDTFV